MISRRSFLKLGVAGFALGYGAYALQDLDTDNIQIDRVDIISPTLPKSFDGYRIGFLTDLHLGGWVPHELIERAVALVNDAGVDLLLLGGDYIWVPDSFSPVGLDTLRNKRFLSKEPNAMAHEIFRDVAQMLRLAKADDGKFAVLGNHDRWSSGDAYLEQFPKEDISLLQNSVGIIRRGPDQLRIIGTEDLWTGVPHLPRMGEPETREFRILLTHNPDYASYTLDRTPFHFDLALSGHTHGGQVKLPLVGTFHYNVEDLRFREGLVHYKRSQVYTSRGIGVVEFPFRINCPPEVTVLTLRSA